jgi:hypothetical protein
MDGANELPPSSSDMLDAHTFTDNQELNYPSVLHFLHTEWRRFERERAEWDLDRTELQV